MANVALPGVPSGAYVAIDNVTLPWVPAGTGNDSQPPAFASFLRQT